MKVFERATVYNDPLKVYTSMVSTRPNISEYHSETSTRVPHCITGAVAGRSFEYPPEHQRVP